MRGFARKLREIFTLRANAQFYATLCACCVYPIVLKYNGYNIGSRWRRESAIQLVADIAASI